MNKAYWEKVLKSHGLGVDQPLTDNSNEPGTSKINDVKGKISQASARRISSDEDVLRQIVDGSESLLEAYEIKVIREISREIPDWSLSDTRVREILLRSFPKLNKRLFSGGPNSRQRARAAKWYHVIYLYYRMRLPRQVVAKELGVTEERLNGLIQRISSAAAGLNTLGKSRKKINRPPAPGEGIGRKGNGETI